MQLSKKESLLLKDQKEHEDMCIKKYNKYANQTKDANLKNLFTDLAKEEQQHLNTLNQIESGQAPNLSAAGSQQQSSGAQQNQAASMPQGSNATAADAEMCTDMLSTEKYVSDTYDTAIFEFRDHATRDALNHIQKEEQQHGEKIYNYMASNGMYNVQ
jgi:rubrerythrin